MSKSNWVYDVFCSSIFSQHKQLVCPRKNMSKVIVKISSHRYPLALLLRKPIYWKLNPALAPFLLVLLTNHDSFIVCKHREICGR